MEDTLKHENNTHNTYYIFHFHRIIKNHTDNPRNGQFVFALTFCLGNCVCVCVCVSCLYSNGFLAPWRLVCYFWMINASMLCTICLPIKRIGSVISYNTCVNWVDTHFSLSWCCLFVIVAAVRSETTNKKLPLLSANWSNLMITWWKLMIIISSVYRFLFYYKYFHTKLQPNLDISLQL